MSSYSFNPGLKEYELMEKAKEEERQVRCSWKRRRRDRYVVHGKGGGATVSLFMERAKEEARQVRCSWKRRGRDRYVVHGKGG